MALRLGTPIDCNLVIGTNVLDDSVDWRNRMFRLTCASAGAAGSHSKLPWNADSFPYGAPWPVVFAVGESFRGAFATGPDASNAILVALTSVNVPGMPSGAGCTIYVDMLTGHLCARLESTNAVTDFVIWVEATGFYPNAF